MTKLFSECRKIPKEECVTKMECIYTNGQKYKYCRLSGRYILDKETGKPVLKTFKYKNRRNLTAKKTSSLSSSSSSSSQKLTEQPKTHLNRTVAANRIAKFFKNTKFRRTARYLSNTCANSGACLAFGTEQKRIKNLFNDFRGLEFIKPPIKRIGNPSANGFVHEIHYQREKYDVYAVLKSSANRKSDNLYYEYLIGTELNSLLNVVPTFVETYGIYKYTTGADWKHAKNTSIIRENILFNGLENLDSLTHREKLATSCEDSKYLAILIQHLKKVFSVKQMIEDKTSTIRDEFIQYDLPYVLFQIYFTLDMLKNEFTHYDLHWSNVLLYVPLSHSHYIHYHYHTRYGKTISFKSTYMAKIIDYGRCYVDKISKKTREELCDERACNDLYTECGESNGYGWLNNKRKDTNRDFIYSQRRNKSHDLRLLKMLTDHVKQSNQKLYDMVFDKIVYDHYYGTKEMARSGLPQNKIQNVSDVYEMLEKYIELSDVKLLNKEIYDDSTFHKLGDLHIHADFGPMRFIENKIIVDENT